MVSAPGGVAACKLNDRRSYWIPGSYAPVLSEKRNSFSGLLKNKGSKEERKTKSGWTPWHIHDPGIQQEPPT